MSERVFCDVCQNPVGEGEDEDKTWLNVGLYPMTSDRTAPEKPHRELDLCRRCTELKVSELVQIAEGLASQRKGGGDR